jgi:hypothetical protein
MTKQSRSKSKGKKKKPRAYKDQSVLPKRASLNTRIANKTNKKLSNATHRSYRAGFRSMWDVAKKTMKKCGVKPLGSYDPKNCHKGVMWGWPFEMNLTNPKVKRIMFDVIDSNELTIGELKHVRRSMSYAWKLNPNKTQDQEDEKNWPCMTRVWKTIDHEELPKTTKKKKRMIVPTPDQLERAFKQQWTPSHELNLGEFVQGTVAAYDAFIWGCRSVEDHDRIKKSRKHVIKRAEGYIKTEYKGGRCKSPGFPRAWSKYTICMCPERKHRSPKSHFKDTVDKKGKPSHGVPWCTTCPVACLEYIWSHDKAKGKTYANAGKKNGKFSSQQADDIPTRAIEWLHSQGTKGNFSHGSGRKSLGLLCNEYNIAYRDSFQIHQDLPKTWKDHYQHGMPKHDPTFTDRDQSKDPETCMVAVRSIAMNWGVGRKVQLKMDRKETLNYYMFRKMGFGKLADDIMSGKIRHTGADDDLPPKVELPDSVKSEDSDEGEQKMQPTPKRKRKRSIVKEEPSDSDFVERPEPPKKKRKRSKPKPKPKAKVKKRKRSKPKPTPKKRKRT